MQLLNEVWGIDDCIEERTVDVHIRLLRQALARTGHAELLETVRGTGCRFAYQPRGDPTPSDRADRAQ